MVKKVTISIPDKVHAKLQKERGHKIAVSGENLPFSKFVVEKLEEASKKQMKAEGKE